VYLRPDTCGILYCPYSHLFHVLQYDGPHGSNAPASFQVVQNTNSNKYSKIVWTKPSLRSVDRNPSKNDININIGTNCSVVDPHHKKSTPEPSPRANSMRRACHNKDSKVLSNALSALPKRGPHSEIRTALAHPASGAQPRQGTTVCRGTARSWRMTRTSNRRRRSRRAPSSGGSSIPSQEALCDFHTCFSTGT